MAHHLTLYHRGADVKHLQDGLLLLMTFRYSQLISYFQDADLAEALDSECPDIASPKHTCLIFGPESRLTISQRSSETSQFVDSYLLEVLLLFHRLTLMSSLSQWQDLHAIPLSHQVRSLGEERPVYLPHKSCQGDSSAIALWCQSKGHTPLQCPNEVSTL